jgi:hypothetical protein
MKHAKHMIIGGVVILAALLLFGVPLSTALQYAVLLACPVMMIGMMAFMNHGSGQSQPACHHDHSSEPVEAPRRAHE